MKVRFISLVITGWCLGFAGFALAGEPPVAPAATTPIGILPAFKRGQVVDIGERNPFGTVVEEVPETVATGAEAAKLSAILESLPVSGVSKDAQGRVRAVLLGDLRLEAGALVPQMVEGQTDELIVELLSETEIVIAWRSEAGRKVAQPRLLRRKIDLDPRVQVLLPGQITFTTGAQKANRKAVVIVPGRSARLPEGIVPTSGLPPSRSK
jgi:hypothetical protein